MKQLLIKLREVLLTWKIYATRSSSYIAFINLGLIMFLALSKLKEVGIININLSSYSIFIYIATVILLVIFGWFDMNYLRGYSQETNIGYKYTPLHPLMQDMKDKLDEMYLLSKEKK